MASQLSIINLAFSHLGEPVVPSLTGDPRPPSVVKALAQWDMALETALAEAGWLCALEYRELTPTEGATDWRYPFFYRCPAKTLRVWMVEDGDAFAWEAGTEEDTGGAVRRVIKAERGGRLRCALVMLRKAEALTPLLANALAWDLASRLAGPIQSNEAKGRAFAERAREAYDRAASAEATEIGGQAPLLGPGPIALARQSAQ